MQLHLHLRHVALQHEDAVCVGGLRQLPGNTATHRNAPQRTATHCNTLQRTATHCNALQRTATHCNTARRCGLCRRVALVRFEILKNQLVTGFTVYIDYTADF